MLSSLRVGLGPRVLSCPLNSDSEVREEQGECPVWETRELLSLCHMDTARDMQFCNQCFSMVTCFCHITQQQLIKFLSQLGDDPLGVQQQFQFKEESKHKSCYWKYSGLTVQHVSHFMDHLLTY